LFSQTTLSESPEGINFELLILLILSCYCLSFFDKTFFIVFFIETLCFRESVLRIPLAFPIAIGIRTATHSKFLIFVTLSEVEGLFLFVTLFFSFPLPNNKTTQIHSSLDADSFG